MDELKRLIREIVEENGLSCSDVEIDKCAHLSIAFAATLKELLAVLENKDIEIDEIIQREYAFLLYAILKKYADAGTGDLSPLLFACIKAIYSNTIKNMEDAQSYYSDKVREMEEEEEKSGSAGAIAYALIDSNLKFFDHDVAMEITHEQAVFIRKYLIETINEWGVQNWIDVDLDNVKMPEKIRKNKEEMTRRKPTKLEVFQETARLCAVREELIAENEELENNINERFDEQNAYHHMYARHHEPAGYRAKPLIIIWFVAIIISEMFVMPLISIVATILCIVIFVLLRKYDHQQADRMAQEVSEKVRLKRIHQEAHRKEWQEQLNENQSLLEKLENYLREQIPYGGVLEANWPRGMRLWAAVESGHADSQKEAINYLEMLDFKIATMTEVEKMHSELARAYDTINALETEQRRMASDIGDLDRRITWSALFPDHPWLWM